MDQYPHADDDAIWRALAHPARRAILDVLRDGPCSTGEIIDALPQGRHSVIQHLAVLRDAGLVIVEPRGRRRLNHLNAVPIQDIHRRWVSQYAEPWTAALVGLKDAVEAASRGRGGEGEERDVG